MDVTGIIAEMLDAETAGLIQKFGTELSEIRLRAGQAVRLRRINDSEICGNIITMHDLRRILSRLMEDSLYALEDELKQGYFTTGDGCRVGICGKISAESGGADNLNSIGSACIRIPRQVTGCADPIFRLVYNDEFTGMLLLSPPGMGKTTMIRDLVRQISDSGWNVALADERRELAACREGMPGLDVGCRTDVMDGCPKAVAIPLLVRACAPDMIAVDEIGSREDVQALMDAARCGVRILASAHALNYEQARQRKQLAQLMNDDIFDWCATLGPEPGRIKEIINLRECAV